MKKIGIATLAVLFLLSSCPAWGATDADQHPINVTVNPALSIASLQASTDITINGFSQGAEGFQTAAYDVSSNNVATAAITDAVTATLSATLPKIGIEVRDVVYRNDGAVDYAQLQAAAPIVPLSTTAAVIATKPASAGANASLLTGRLFVPYFAKITAATAGVTDGGSVNVTVTLKDA